MAQLLLLREQIKNFYSKYEVFITPTLKFLLAFITLILINAKIGFAQRLSGLVIVVLAALFCSFLPMNFIVIIAAHEGTSHRPMRIP